MAHLPDEDIEKLAREAMTGLYDDLCKCHRDMSPGSVAALVFPVGIPLVEDIIRRAVKAARIEVRRVERPPFVIYPEE